MGTAKPGSFSSDVKDLEGKVEISTVKGEVDSPYIHLADGYGVVAKKLRAVEIEVAELADTATDLMIQQRFGKASSEQVDAALSSYREKATALLTQLGKSETDAKTLVEESITRTNQEITTSINTTLQKYQEAEQSGYLRQ